MTPEDARSDMQTYNNVRTVDELNVLLPGMDWQAYLAALGLTDTTSLIVGDITYLEALSGLLDEQPIATLRAYFAAQLIWSAAPYLTEEIGDIAFSFEGTVLNGIVERRPLELRALQITQDTFPDALGQLYVDGNFSPVAKAAIEELVANLIDAFRIRIENSAWMSDATKLKAIEKLDKMRVKVGYPDTWESYEGVDIGDSLYETMANAENALLRENLDKIGKPVDPSDWDIAVFEVNAYYNPLGNEIVFPAAILQAPFFDPAADPASNYGGIGYVIGHEITHGFDLGGSQFDGNGNLTSWWSDQDRAAFQALNDRVVEQYGAIEALPDLYINGQLTIGENVADMGGLQTAYDALQIAISNLTEVERSDLPWFLTQDQRFFISAATIWRLEARPEFIRYLISADVHSPAVVRAVQPLRNMDAFFEAFSIGSDDPMYLPPDERVVVW